MKIYYIIVAIVVLSCSCEDSIVEGIAVPVTNSENTSAIEPVAKPKLLVQPQVLPADVSKSSSVVKSAILKPIIERLPRISTPKKSADDNIKESVPAKPLTKTEPTVDDNLKTCADALCPLIYCQNSLPAIPTQGICCQRCVTNPKCNTSACPKYKCATHLVPANLTAGECCDHCAPVSVKPATSSSSDEEEEDEEYDDSKSSSSSEQIDGRSVGCNIRLFNPKPHRSRSYLIRLLTENFGHLRHHHSHRGHHNTCDSHEKK